MSCGHLGMVTRHRLRVWLIVAVVSLAGLAAGYVALGRWDRWCDLLIVWAMTVASVPLVAGGIAIAALLVLHLLFEGRLQRVPFAARPRGAPGGGTRSGRPAQRPGGTPPRSEGLLTMTPPDGGRRRRAGRLRHL
ncbi:MAG TPA: hypothetical protein VJM33_00700 [Microthrixaceae bacterium]|nr:hypothetical protein [Microthrixaceae bacterium]